MTVGTHRPSESTGNPDRFPSIRHHLTRRWSPGGARILVLGDSMLDAYIVGAVDRISPEAPVPVVRQAETRESAGGAANLAANVRSLGGMVHLVSCVGADAEAGRLSALLAGAGVETSLVDVAPRPTTLKTRFASGQQQLLRLDREQADAIPVPSEDRVIAALAQQVERCSLLVISDYSKGMLTDRVLRQAISLAERRSVPVFVDPKRSDFSIYRGASVLKPNRRELEAATGLPVRSDAQIDHAAAAAAARTGATILVTRAESGMSLVRPDGSSIHLATQAREVFDVTGAGDTVMAALAVGVASGLALEEAMAFANLAGGIAVSRHGTAQVTAAELVAERDRIADDQAAGGATRVDLGEAVRLRNVWKREGLVVGFTNGCFDLLHPGHIALLRGAAQACDRLIVGLNGDASVRRLKGKERPVQQAEARATVLGAIEHVDLIVVFDEDTPGQLISRLMPDVLVKGADYALDQIVGADTVRAAGGRVLTVDLVPGQSTTRLVAAGRKTAPVT